MVKTTAILVSADQAHVWVRERPHARPAGTGRGDRATVYTSQYSLIHTNLKSKRGFGKV